MTTTILQGLSLSHGRSQKTNYKLCSLPQKQSLKGCCFLNHFSTDLRKKLGVCNTKNKAMEKHPHLADINSRLQVYHKQTFQRLWSPDDLIYKISVHILSKPEVLADGRVKCTLQVFWGKFDGYGKNSKIAKATAAKLAVQALDRRDSPGTSQGSG